MLKYLMCACFIAVVPSMTSSAANGQNFTMEAVNEAIWEREQSGSTSPGVIKLQVLLDRAHASPGAIDGRMGTNTQRAIAAFREITGEKGGEEIDDQLWQTLTSQDREPALVRHVISDADVEGPFIKQMPEDFREMSKLSHLSYTSVQEKLAEWFHMTEDLIRALNPKAEFDRPGTEIVVANVRREGLPGKVARLEVKQEQVRAFAKDDRILAIYPATIGSEERPSPTGDFEVTAIAEDPIFYFDPALNFRNVEAQEKLKLPPGPNNPVGVVWISISAKGYGIHGTPHPHEVGKTASHGCIRLTNWDARELSKHVSKATAVTISDAAVRAR
jgi:lipoprotein-anchoring transpeptidase ErfK/SrfK